jgi:gliding motility-associated lipoprotein GldH
MPFLTVALTLVGCNRKTIYSHYEHTSIDGWENNDTLAFTVENIQSDGIYSEEVGLRINSVFPFTGLTLIVQQQTMSNGKERSDTLHARLISQDGTIQGQGISYFQYNFHLADLRLKASDTLHVKIHHGMKREVLPGISDLGLILTKKD